MIINSINSNLKYNLFKYNDVTKNKLVASESSVQKNEFSCDYITALKSQLFYNPSFSSTRLVENSMYNLKKAKVAYSENNVLAKIIQKKVKPNGVVPFKDIKDVTILIDGLRDDIVRDYQILTLDFYVNETNFEEGSHIAKIVSQINTIQRGELFEEQIKKYMKDYPTLKPEELVAIIPRLSEDKLDLQEKFVKDIYLSNSEDERFKSLETFSELLSSIEKEDVANLQLEFFNELVNDKNVEHDVAMSIIMNIDDNRKGRIKKVAVMELIDQGFSATSLKDLVPKIRSTKDPLLYKNMGEYFLKEKGMKSDIAVKIMCNIPNKDVFNLHKNIIEEISNYRVFRQEDILKILGDVQTPQTAELKTSVVKLLSEIEKLNGKEIAHIVTNVDTVLGADIKIKTAKQLAKLDKLNGEQIGFIVAGCNNVESSLVKCNTATELDKIQGIDGNAIRLIVSRILKQETADLQIEAVKELMRYDRFTDDEIAQIVRNIRNVDFQLAKLAALDKIIKYEKLDNTALVAILGKINGESKDKYLLECVEKMVVDENFTCEDITKIVKSFTINKHTCSNLIDYFSTLPREIKDGITDYSIVQDFYPFVNKKYKNKTDVKALINALIKHNTDIFKPENETVLKLYPFLPKNNEQFCSELSELLNSVNKNTVEISGKQRKAMKDLSQNIEALYKNEKFLEIDFEKMPPPTLKYNVEDFKKDVLTIIEGCSSDNAQRLTDQFGFVLLKGEDENYQILGYPQMPKNYVDFKNNYKLASLNERLKVCVKNFVNSNKVNVCKDEEINQTINNIFDAIPELYTIVGKPQNRWHHFDVFVHTMKVLQEVIKNERFNKLEKNDKKIVFLSALLHDISKKEKVVDKGHALTSAYDAHQIVGRMGMSDIDKSKLFAVIRNHEWLKYYNKEGISDLQKTERAKTVAFTLREGNAFELVSILAEADLKAMQKKNTAFKLFEKALMEGNSEVSRYIRDLQRTSIHLPQSRLPKASEIEADGKVVRIAKIGGIENKVIYLTKGMGKGSLPFDEELDPIDLNFLVHALDNEKNSLIFQRLEEIDNDTLISASYINLPKGNWKTFRQQGYILLVDSDNIHAAYYKDYGSGTTKNIDTLKLDYLFEGYFKPQRNYISQKIKSKLGIDDENYKSLYQKIKNKTLAEIRVEYPLVSTAIKEIYMEMQGGEYTYGRNYNEVLVSRSKIQGVYAYDRSITQVPRYLRKYAAEADIPIIIFLD